MSKPVRAYSALGPQVSILVYNLKLLILPSAFKRLTVSVSLSTSLGLTPMLLFTSICMCGLGSLSNFSNSFQKLLCINGSPPVIRKMFSVLLSSGHHSQNAFTYGLVSSSFCTSNQSMSCLCVLDMSYGPCCFISFQYLLEALG